MSEPLYTREILRLAASNPREERLERPHGSAARRSQTCGSQVACDVMMSAEGRIIDLGFDVHACALGQASASILAREAMGQDSGQIANVRQALAEFLGGQRARLDSWPSLAPLESARPHPGRHAAILLPYDALIAACVDAAPAKETA